MKLRKKRAMVVPRRRSRQSVAMRLIPLVVAVFMGAALYLLFGTDRFELREVEFYGSGSLPHDSLKVIRAGLIGRNMITMPLSVVRERILGFPEIRDVVFRRRLFNKLDCYLIQRKPVALIAGTGIVEIDSEGVVIPRRAGEGDVDLPVITGLSQEQLEAPATRAALSRALTALRLLNEYGFSPAEQLSEIHVEGDEIMFVWLKTGTLIRLGSEDFESRIRKLCAVYGALGISEGFPELIDLRFDRQVVVR
jgi:cell division septal protein FtsQ